MAWYNNHYECECGCKWADEWSCMCNDECPECGLSDIEPHESDDLSVLIEPGVIFAGRSMEESDTYLAEADARKAAESSPDGTFKWIVSISGDDAEEGPAYRMHAFDTKAEAEAFAAEAEAAAV